MARIVNLNRGYDGFAPWTDIGVYGFVLVTYDNPLHARFRFLSDGAWSDEDGLYASVGGGFACDNVKVFDYFGGYEFFYDDEPGDDECIPAVPGAAGDFWHVIDRACPALSDPHSWWCGDDADTSLVPPNLQDALFSPTRRHQWRGGLHGSHGDPLCGPDGRQRLRRSVRQRRRSVTTASRRTGVTSRRATVGAALATTSASI